MEVRIGTSGWTYRHWRGDFYPAGLPQRRELSHLADRMNSAEINGSFYSLQRPSSYRRWGDVTPDDFVFAVKGGRFLTHMKKLRDIEAPLASFLASGMLALGPKLGPMLWQLPPNLGFDRERIESFFAQLPPDTATANEIAATDTRIADRFGEGPALAEGAVRRLRHAVEVRHPSFDSDDFARLCEQYGVALVLADTAGRFPWIDRVTTNFGYVRLHGSRELYVSGYTDEEVDWWSGRIEGWRDQGLDAIYLYFDNDAQSHAAWDALRLRSRTDDRLSNR